MNNLQTMKMEECRSLHKWYYHLSLDGLEKNQLFNCDEQFARGMNSVALGQHIHKVKIVNFNLMVNHCHILGYGNGADFVDLFLFLKKRFNAKLVKDGFPPLTDNYFFKLVKVEDKPQLESVIIYIARNPCKAQKRLVPSGDIRGSNYLIFSDITRLIEKTFVKDLGVGFLREALHSRKSLPDDYVFNKPNGQDRRGSW